MSASSHEAPAAVAALIDRVAARDFRLGVIGLGYVGIPLALTACKAGFKVTGFDIDARRVAQINRGESFIKHIGSAVIAEAVKGGAFQATDDFDRLGEVDAIIIAVPTPLTKQREPDLSYVENTAKAIAPRLRKNHLVVLESTTWPGTTNEVMQADPRGTGLKSGKDFFLAFSPEREDPGNPDFGTSLDPQGGGRRRAGRAGSSPRRSMTRLVTRTVPVSSTATAEAVKLTENIFRAVNIALVNELKVIYDRWASTSGR
jgi:UDP-N-acetyl-D-glucosamine dehydrogenase